MMKLVLFQGAQNVNVFLGSYASHLAGKGKKEKFDDWLQKVAPYKSIGQLASFLEGQGIGTLSLGFQSNDEVMVYEGIRHDLEYAYKHDSFSRGHPKPPVLIGHEARQLARMSVDLRGDRKCL